MWPRQEGLQGVWEDWHREREEARQNGFNLNEFGETAQVKYDLDTAGITGEDNDRTFEWDRPLNEERNGTDIREFANR